MLHCGDLPAIPLTSSSMPYGGVGNSGYCNIQLALNICLFWRIFGESERQTNLHAIL